MKTGAGKRYLELKFRKCRPAMDGHERTAHAPADRDWGTVAGRDEMLPAANVTVANAAGGKYDYLLISRVTCENRNPDAPGHITDIYSRATARRMMRTKHEMSRFFSCVELVEPGVVYLAQWRRAAKYYAGGGTIWGHAGAGGKAGRSASARAASDAAFLGRGATRRSH